MMDYHEEVRSSMGLDAAMTVGLYTDEQDPCTIELYLVS
jgi:hypothetical protein